jgi:Trypsin-like peptidase domain
MWIRPALILFLIFAVPSLGRASGPDDSLVVYSVGVNGGAGIYLGNGLVLSVAHVVGGGIISKPTVTIAGQKLLATVVKESPFEQLDLALLEFDESGLPVSLRLRRMPLCQGKPWPGEEVISLSAQGPVRSRILSTTALPFDVRRFSTVIRDVATTGNSGSGVFEAQRKCLLGIMSRKISQIRRGKNTGEKTTQDIAKYFVPSATIADFMPARLRLPPESTPPVQFSYRQ